MLWLLQAWGGGSSVWFHGRPSPFWIHWEVPLSVCCPLLLILSLPGLPQDLSTGQLSPTPQPLRVGPGGSKRKLERLWLGTQPPGSLSRAGKFHWQRTRAPSGAQLAQAASLTPGSEPVLSWVGAVPGWTDTGKQFASLPGPGLDSGSDLLACHLAAVRPQASGFCSLGPRYPICKMGVIMQAAWAGVGSLEGIVPGAGCVSCSVGLVSACLLET